MNKTEQVEVSVIWRSAEGGHSYALTPDMSRMFLRVNQLVNPYWLDLELANWNIQRRCARFAEENAKEYRGIFTIKVQHD